MKKKTLFVSLFVLFVTVFGVVMVEAQGPRPGTRAPSGLAGTAFTYQGQLKQSGSAVNNTCDFVFSLWDGPDLAASQIGGNQPKTNVSVSNGLFTISDLDFGSDAFNGDARYLLIAVRCPAGGGSFVALAPRQPLTPAPMAFALPGFYTQQNATSPNLIGGYSGNTVTSGVKGATISGGGYSGSTNRVTDDYGTVSGGYSNQAGNNAGTTSDVLYATVGGGQSNTASADATTIGGGIYNTASSQYATVGGGNSNSASAYAATIGGGWANHASGGYATVPGGMNASATHYGEMAYASGYFSTNGDAQTSVYVLRRSTSDATLTELFLNGSGQRITLATDRTLTFDILITARSSGGASAGYQLLGVIENVSGTTALVGAITKRVLGENDIAWDGTVEADNTNGALVVKVTGAASTNIRWVATARTVEVAY